MTRLDTKYNAAKNWSQRLPVARDIWHEIRAESLKTYNDVVYPLDVDSLSPDELERLTAPQNLTKENSENDKSA